MKDDQPLQKIEFDGAGQLDLLEEVMDRIIEAMDKGRNEVFFIRQNCHDQEESIRQEINGIMAEREQLKADLTVANEKERLSRLHLMEVSQDFQTFSEEAIKTAYEEARLIQVVVLEIKERKKYLERRNEELNQLIEQVNLISERAERLMNHTNIAIKLLMGNIDRITNVIEGANREQMLEMWIIESQESERRKIARDLHDGPAKSLASLLIRLNFIEQMIPKQDNAELLNELYKVETIGRDSLEEIRKLIFDLKPTFIHEDGLINTMKEYFDSYEAKHGLEINFAAIGKIRKFELALEIALFRIVQEAITNVRKHSGSSKVSVRIEETGNMLLLLIEDKGKGFNAEKNPSSQENFGIMGMKERVELFGGVIDIVSSPGGGTQVHVKVPLRKEAYHGKR